MLIGLVTMHLALVGPAAAETNTQRAKRHNAAAERLFNVGMFREAAREYQKAYRAKPVSEFLYNLGQCYRRLDTVKDLERALFYFKSYLRNAAPDTSHHGAVEQVMARTRKRLERLRLALPGPTRPALQPGPLFAAPAPPASRPSSTPVPLRPAPFYKRWWFWTVIGGVVVAAAATTTAVVVTRDDGRVDGSLPPGTIEVQ